MFILPPYYYVSHCPAGSNLCLDHSAIFWTIHKHKFPNYYYIRSDQKINSIWYANVYTAIIRLPGLSSMAASKTIPEAKKTSI